VEWRDVTIADSDETIVIERNHYCPPDAVDWNLLESTTETSVCPSKGTAHYYTIAVKGTLNPNAAWTYTDPKPENEPKRDYVAFWRGVNVG
jgi:uncharacterized protein (DUF427 family)